MKTILKYPLAARVAMPQGAVIIDCQMDPSTGGLAIWALVDPEAVQKAENETRFFITSKTGQALPDSIMDCAHLGTIVMVITGPEGHKAIVTHAWEIPAAVVSDFTKKEEAQ